MVAMISACFDVGEFVSNETRLWKRMPRGEAVLAVSYTHLDVYKRQTLEDDGSDFAKATLAQLRGHSPSSVHWSFEIIRRGAAQDLADCLASEFALVCQIAMSGEFIEGVRALLIDKDKAPKWQPPLLEEVDPAKIAALFEPKPR